MHESITQLRTVLQDHRKSITKPRKLVFQALLNSAPISMSGLVKQLQGTIDRVSIYRTVQLFESLGIAQRVHLGWKYNLELSDAFQPHHHHLTCVKCGLIIPLHEHEKLENLITELAAAESFRLTKHQIELQGFCVHCESPLTS